jgi:hypothetical protein
MFVGCSKKPGSVVEDFYNAKNWEERKSLIYDYEGLRQNKVEEYCDIGGLPFKGISETNEYSKDVYQVNMEYGEHQKKNFIVRKVNGQWKIDMKAMIGYSDKVLLRCRYIRAYNDGTVILEIPWLYDGARSAELYLLEDKIGPLIKYEKPPVLIEAQSSLENAVEATGRLNSYLLSKYKLLNDSWIEN